MLSSEGKENTEANRKDAMKRAQGKYLMDIAKETLGESMKPSNVSRTQLASLKAKLKKAYPDKDIKCSTKDAMVRVNGKVAYDMDADYTMDEKYKKLEKALLGESMNLEEAKKKETKKKETKKKETKKKETKKKSTSKSTSKNTNSLLDMPSEWMKDENEEKKVSVPADVKKALKDQIGICQKMSDELAMDHPEQQMVHAKIAEQLAVLLKHLEKGTCADCKKAVMHYHESDSDIRQKVPAEVLSFLTTGGKVSLKDYFNVAKAGK
jgi:hypothetical protein